MVVDYTLARRQHVVDLLLRTGVLDHPELSNRAKLLYTVGALIADEHGRIAKDDLHTALQDERAVRYAIEVMSWTLAGRN
jgi:hypothetical protein